MHISEGILSTGFCLSGYAGTALLTAFGLKHTKNDHIPAVAVMGAAFFTASLIHFKIGVTSVHLTLLGLTAIILGVRSLPAILAGLFFQTVLFQHGGISTLGINGLIMMVPALFCQSAFRALTGINRRNSLYVSLIAGSLTFISVLLATILAAGILLLSGDGFMGIAAIFSLSNSVLALVEGIITGIVVNRLLKIKPEMILSWQRD